jgi:hypothetical protein
MKSFFTVTLRVYLFKVILALTLISSILLAYVFWQTKDAQLSTLLAGVSTGLFVAALQLLMSWNEHQEIESIKKLGIRQILPHREGKEYYQRLIEGAKRTIWVAGVTVQRFMEDFATDNRSDCRSLIDALDRGVDVKILVPNAKFLNAKDAAKATISRPQLEKFTQHWNNFGCRVFDHPPAHSMVVVDGECLLGPVFSHVESKSSPAIHLSTSSEYSREYINYFNHEWDEAQPI